MSAGSVEASKARLELRSHMAPEVYGGTVFCTCRGPWTFWPCLAFDIANTVQRPERVHSLHAGCWHAANAKNLLVMKLHKAIIVPA
jgi:hypothetical protein